MQTIWVCGSLTGKMHCYSKLFIPSAVRLLIHARMSHMYSRLYYLFQLLGSVALTGCMLWMLLSCVFVLTQAPFNSMPLIKMPEKKEHTILSPLKKKPWLYLKLTAVIHHFPMNKLRYAFLRDTIFRRNFLFVTIWEGFPSFSLGQMWEFWTIQWLNIMVFDVSLWQYHYMTITFCCRGRCRDGPL